MHQDPSSVDRLAPAPRALSPSLAARVVFGNFMSQFGWGFVAFGMVFVWVFDAGAGLSELLTFRGDVATVAGVSTGWSHTSLTINDRAVYETAFRARLPDGRLLEGSSFGTGEWVEEGEAVTVEYVDGDPPEARIRGLRASSGGLMVVFTFIFPLVGLGMALGALRRGLGARRLMMNGSLTRGVLRSTEATSTRINNRPVMELTFDFEVDGAGYQAVARTHRPYTLEDEVTELLVYDPRDPSAARLLDELPCQPRVDDRGGFEASTPSFPAALYLLLPGLSTLTLLRYLSTLL